MNLGKKIIALSLVAVMSLQTVNASVIDRALSNYTPPQSATITDSEGNTVKSMFYTGSFYYRFADSATPQLLWTFSPPEVEVGCNGFNLKGMFMSLLGIDQFGSMLQNAGTSLAWGVAIGLIYSLPGVASVFKFINQWAKDIQKLLSSACQSGIAIGQAIAANTFGEDVKKFEEGVDSTLTGWTLAGSKQEGIKGIGDKLGLPGLNLKWENGLSFTGKDTVPDSVKKDVFAQAIAKMFRSHSVGASILLKQIERKNQIGVKIDNAINAGRMKEAAMIPIKFPLLYDGVSLTSNGIDTDFTNITVDFLSKSAGNPDDQTTFGLKMLAYTFLYNLVGDMGYSATALDSKIKAINDGYNCSGIVSGTDKSKCEAGAEDYGRLLREFIEDGSGSPLIPSVVGNGIINITPGNYYTALVDGFNDPNFKDKPLSAPIMYMIAIKGKNSGANYDYLLFPTSPIEHVNFFNSTAPFPGLRDISQCSLYNVLKSQGLPDNDIDFLRIKKGGGKTSTKLTCDALVSVPDKDGNIVTTGTYPVLLYGDITTLASLISKLRPSERAWVIERIEAENTYTLISSMLNQMSTILGNTNVDSNKPVAADGSPALDQKVSKTISPISEGHQKSMSDIRNQWSKINDEFKVKMKEEFGANRNPDHLISLVYYLEKLIQERALKNSAN